MLGKRTGCGLASTGVSLLLHAAQPPLRGALFRTGTEAPSPSRGARSYSKLQGLSHVCRVIPRAPLPVPGLVSTTTGVVTSVAPESSAAGDASGGLVHLRLPQPREDGAGGGGPPGPVRSRRNPAVGPGVCVPGLPARHPPPWTVDRRVGGVRAAFRETCCCHHAGPACSPSPPSGPAAAPLQRGGCPATYQC